MRKAALILALLLLPLRAFAQQLTLQLDSEEVYASLPFVLSVLARGFDENPQPTLSKLAIPGCKITPLGVQPQVSSVQIVDVNGQRSQSRNVTFAFRFRIEADRAGQFTVPPLTAEQGGKKASSPPARFAVRAVDDSRDMQLRLVLPERPLWVGETVDAALEWYLRKDVGHRSFAVPLFDEEAWVDIEAPPGEPRIGGFHAGSRQLELPYEQSKATLDGVEYTRFRILFRLTPSKPGTLIPPPPRVVAELQTGVGRDLFGFSVPESRLFQAVAKPTTLEIRPLPLAGRPPSFKNAIGHAFGIEVQAGRTVVRVGDPIELRILLRGKGRLAGLILPELATMGLSEQQFAAPEEPPSGEVLDDGKGKLFRVSVRLRGTDAQEIPALAFSYFDPAQGAYKTVRSQPIALSVKGSAVVGANDVVSAPPPAGSTTKPAANQPAQAAPAPALSLVGADLALSDERLTLRAAPSLQRVLPLIIGLYGAALLLLILQAVRVRKQADWQRAAQLEVQLRQLQKALDAAVRDAARDAAPRLCAALRALHKELALPTGEGQALLERLETEAYSPSAANAPLSPALRGAVEALVKAWRSRPRTNPNPARVATLLLLFFSLGALGVTRAHAQDGAAEQSLRRARATYQAALAESDRDRRRSGFAEAESALRQLAVTYADRAELAADWGNAALLAQEPGRAVLAYRRALALDPTLPRARRNLTFLRERLPDWLPRPRTSGALDSIAALGQSLAAPYRQVGLSAMVLLAVALCIPWSLRRRRLLRTLALVPIGIGAAFALSLVVEHDPAHDAVVVTAGVLRSADSLGAPPALGQPLPAGAEVSISELRGDFTRISLADGQTGWLQASALEPVVAARP